jgi:hypothetical protein
LLDALPGTSPVKSGLTVDVQHQLHRKREIQMRRSLVLAGLLFLTAGSVLAQDDFPKVETSPAFMFIRNSPNFTRPFQVNGTAVSGSNYFLAQDEESLGWLNVTRSVWRNTVGDPKTAKSKAPVPVIPQLAQRLEAHRLKCGKPVAARFSQTQSDVRST